MEWGHHEYSRLLGVEELWCGRLEALLCGLRSRFVDHMSFFDFVRGFLRQDMDRDLDDGFRAVFSALRDLTPGFHSATSSVVETHIGTLHRDVSSILTHLDGRLADSAFQPSVKTSSDPLGPGIVLPPSYRIV